MNNKDSNPCINCLVFPICKTRFKPNPFISISIMGLIKHCHILYEFVTYYTPMEIHHEGKVTPGQSHQRDQTKEAQVYTYYTSYNSS